MNGEVKLSNQTGASLMEVLISLAVIGFGIVGVMYLQGQLSVQSAHNKAKAEAIAIAEGRIEERRNYYDQLVAAAGDTSPEKLASLMSVVPACDPLPDSTAVNGTNATFSLVECRPDIERNLISIIVSWVYKGEQASVSISSDISEPSVFGVASEQEDLFSKTLNPPTGIALLGEGVLSTDAVEIPVAQSDDGIRFYYDDVANEDGERKPDELYDLLIVDGNDQILLTLPSICGSVDDVPDTSCANQVVTINGRVFIDNEELESMLIDDVLVTSSDNTYCSMFNKDPDSNPSYKIFDYRCYASEGWEGNIGLLLKDGFGKLGTKICQGDPAYEYGWQQPVLSPRRVYRTSNAAGVGSGQDIGYVFETAENGDPLFILDDNGFPTLNYVLDNDEKVKSHNFVITVLSPSSVDGQECVDAGVLLRSGATIDGVPGALFAGMHSEFYCLNPHIDDPAGREEPCPPWLAKEVFEYEISYAGTATVSTSSSSDPCIDNKCIVFDWIDDGVGWSGYLQADVDLSSSYCNYDRYFFADITENATGPSYECSDGESFVIRGGIALLDQAKISGISLNLYRNGIGDEGEHVLIDTQSNCEVSPSVSAFSCVSGNISGYAISRSELVIDTNVAVCTDYGDGTDSDIQGDGVIVYSDIAVEPDYPIINKQITVARTCP
jgi:hypothetical protein